MQRISSKVAGSFTLGQVLDMAEKLDVPEQATLPVYSEGIKAVMDIGQYCRDVRLGKKTWGKKYFQVLPAICQRHGRAITVTARERQ